jgi:hypothetical protein
MALERQHFFMTKPFCIRSTEANNMARMRAKFRVFKVESYDENSEILSFSAVGAVKYGEAGENEDNDFARWTPSGELKMGVTNPDLLGTIKVGEKYYLDFTKAE